MTSSGAEAFDLRFSGPRQVPRNQPTLGAWAMTRPTASSFWGHRWEPELGIVFSSREGFVWASWPETEATVRLGRHDMVAAMMQDFLAQDALGKRLNTPRAVDD
jgi:hypothetical protein